MRITFRWFGPDDPVQLGHIRQIPVVDGVVTSLHDVAPGDPWPQERIESLKAEINEAGLDLSAIESLPVHEDIKLGRPGSEVLIEVYAENLARLGRAGIRVVCYNFMPLFDWFRTDLAYPLLDGSTSLEFDQQRLTEIPDPFASDLPAWSAVSDSQAYLAAYRDCTEGDLWKNLGRFLRGVVPAAEAAGIRLGIHPDDPPWSIYGLPRIIVDESALQRVLGLVDSEANGLTFCSGSLGARPENDLTRIVQRFSDRIHFVHLRNIRRTGENAFHETAHPLDCGDLNLPAIVQALRHSGFRGPVRPDHGRMIWGETGIPGYGLFDRALGAVYIAGLRDAHP
jgi:mannonate dehydratase